MGPYAGYLLETFVTLLAVCGLAFVVLYGARRLGIGRPRGPIQLVGQLPLDARRAIYLVQVGGQVLVIGASEAGITKLGEVLASELPAVDPTSHGPPFGDVLARVLGTKRAPLPAEAAKPERPE
jgi:flagellar biogenesis protein FliO